jgi:hypothetical protein
MHGALFLDLLLSIPTSSMPLRLPPLPSRTYAVPSIPRPNFPSVPPLFRRLLLLPCPSVSLPMSHVHSQPPHSLLIINRHYRRCILLPPLQAVQGWHISSYLPPACADSAGARVRAPTSRRVRRTSSCTVLLFRQFSVHLSSSLPSSSFSSHFHVSFRIFLRN